jgi:hypothetical protein
MRFEETELSGAYIIRLQANEDERGSFVRTFCRTEFEKRGLNSRVVQCNFSYNLKRGTLRGLHYQETPYAEAKLVICLTGSIYDVIVDLRRDSPNTLPTVSRPWKTTPKSSIRWRNPTTPQPPGGYGGMIRHSRSSGPTTGQSFQKEIETFLTLFLIHKGFTPLRFIEKVRWKTVTA